MDPRGLKSCISQGWECGYRVNIRFPNRDRPSRCDGKPFVTGVTFHEAVSGDVYVGTADALITAGLATSIQLPGQPGCPRKTTSVVFADGSMPTGSCNTSYSKGRLPGAKHIRRASKNVYEVTVQISEEVSRSRREASIAMDRQFEKEMLALPRPPRLPKPPGLRIKSKDGVFDSDVAERKLKDIPRSAEQFKRQVLQQLRAWFLVWFTVEEGREVKHGYRLSDDGSHEIKLAFDAVADAVMRSGVEFDQTVHASEVLALQSQIARDDSSFQSRLAAMMRSASATGEAS
jgi:hypothetical protein